MKGYDAYYKTSAKEITFSGKVNDGNFSMSLTNSVNGGNGYNLVGNPYPSSIDWNAVTGWTKTNIDNAVYFWDDKTQNISSYVSGLKSNGGSNIIPATMAFFVKCNKTTGGTLSMTNKVRVSNQETFRNSEANDFLKISISGNGFSDEAIIGFNADATNFYDGAFDAEKMFSYNIAVPQVYTTDIDFQPYSINVLQENAYSKNINLGIKTGAEGNYKLSFNTNNLNQAANLFVEDTYTNTIHDVNTGAYNFTSEAGEITDRFVLHFVPVTPILNSEVNTTGTEEASVNSFNVFASNNAIMVLSNEISENTMVFIYNTMGQLITSSSIENSTLNKIQLPENTSGCMIVSVVENNQVISNSKVIIK